MSEAAGAPVAMRRLELAATVLLALATVGTAWSGYQASRWNGEQAKAFSRATSLRIESAKADDLANAQTQVDVATFMQWVDATAQGDAQLAAFYERRFRAELKPAFDAWLATKPLTNSRAPLTPFKMPQYTVAERAKAEQLEAQAEAWAAKARTDVQRATNYVLAVVLFAAALFFAGICTKLETPRLRRFLLAFGVVVLFATLVWIATFPVSLSI
jgi:hypothetical protein